MPRRHGLACLVVLLALTGCTAPPPGAYTPNAVDAPRSPGNAALAVRFAMIFDRLCLEPDEARARATAERLGFVRTPASVATAAGGRETDENWLRGGYDTYILNRRSPPDRGCDLGVHLAEAAQVEPAFARLMETLRGRGFEIGPLGRRSAGLVHEATTPDGQRRRFYLIPVEDRTSTIRSMLSVDML